MIHEIVRIQGINIPQINLLVLGQLQFSGYDLKILVLDIVIVIGKSIPIEVHHVQDTLFVFTNDDTLDLLTLLLSELIAIVLFLDPTLESDSTLEIIILHMDPHQDHVHDLSLHPEDLLIMYNQIPLEIMTFTLKTFQSNNRKLKLLCIALN